MSRRGRPLVAPKVADAGDLNAFELSAGALHDELELELEDVRVTGAAAEVAVRNLELGGARLDDVDLAGARLPRLALRNCRVTGSNLANVTVRDGVAERCAFDNVRMTGFSWQDGLLRDVSFRGCRIDLASFAASRLERVLFEDCSLAQVELQDTLLTAVCMRDCDLREADLTGLRVSAGWELRGCVLDGTRGVASLRGARMPYVDVLAAAGTFAHALGISIIDPDDEEAVHPPRPSSLT